MWWCAWVEDGTHLNITSTNTIPVAAPDSVRSPLVSLPVSELWDLLEFFNNTTRVSHVWFFTFLRYHTIKFYEFLFLVFCVWWGLVPSLFNTNSVTQSVFRLLQQIGKSCLSSYIAMFLYNLYIAIQITENIQTPLLTKAVKQHYCEILSEFKMTVFYFNIF